MQLIIKIAIIGAVIVGAVIVVFKVWRMDIDTPKLKPARVAEKFVNDTLSVIPQRDKNSIYQNGEIVAIAVGFKHNPENNTCCFDELYKSNSLDLDATFEFKEFKLQFEHAETMIGLNPMQADKGRMIKEVTCIIIGKR